jgi:methyl halide transferase
LLDWSESVISDFKKRSPHFPVQNILIGDFFEHTGNYDLIIEQTFFCAIFPAEREKYVKKAFDLLNPGGKLVGLLFNHDFGNDFPPYGGNETEYKNYFIPFFQIIYFSTAVNSIKPREGREFFINLKKL